MRLTEAAPPARARLEVVGIAAVGRNGVIGAGNDIPWRISQDWARFKAITTGHTLVMGRRTYDSIGRPLPGRRTVVVTRNADWSAEGVETAPDVETALARAAELGSTVFVAGGGEIYRAAWDRLDRLEVTEVDIAPEGDVTFPVIDPAAWIEEQRDLHDGFAFVRWRRRTAV